jgi:hypothetical protein
MASVLQKTIMRRVYYSYTLSILSHTMFWQGMFLAIATLFLGKWLHVASIIHNVLAVPLTSTPEYAWSALWNAATHGELLTALTFLLAGGLSVSAGYHLANLIPRQQFSKTI